MRHQPGDPCYTELPLQALDAARVEAVWRYAPLRAGRQLVLPDGRMDLVVHCAVRPDGNVAAVWPVLAGPADQPTWAALRPGSVVLGVRFRIGWGGACLGVAPRGLCNRVLAGDAVLGLLQPLGALADDLMNATTLAAAHGALCSIAGALAACVEPTAAHGRALAALAQLQVRLQVGASRHAAGPPVAAVAESWAGGGDAASRRLRRDIASAVGLPLRTLAGILRFQQALASLEAGAALSITEVALACGYADQAHMTREFRRFGGFTPALPQAAPVVRWAPEPARSLPLSETFKTRTAVGRQTARH
ncbi:helix-turn-helix domain-containing protein [Acidovorax sp. sic0104]|uniref:AraC family transcriptional regulator n=1 Tax=Acidovorax sp. sic0104 TaxID=2854784 RepID=UPI001C48602F|nr:helix-turn-helix domain-containing protein [Acidovorax sp. sic0104]MBV7542359.1 helix-turn-helix domain-containing protein [Acidovorax sp. sic0104]